MIMQTIFKRTRITPDPHVFLGVVARVQTVDTIFLKICSKGNKKLFTKQVLLLQLSKPATLRVPSEPHQGLLETFLLLEKIDTKSLPTCPTVFSANKRLCSKLTTYSVFGHTVFTPITNIAITITIVFILDRQQTTN